MREQHDALTLTLPGVPELPAVPAHPLPVKARQALVNYRGPKERPSCRSCRYRQEGPAPGTRGQGLALRDAFHCARPEAHFPVHLGGWCSSWAHGIPDTKGPQQ